MNKTSSDKIKSATVFLIWFCGYLPESIQAHVRPYLEQPYQLSLNILDCCTSTQPLLVKEIATAAGVTRETVRQVLQALKEGGMTFAVNSTEGCLLKEGETLASNSLNSTSKF